MRLVYRDNQKYSNCLDIDGSVLQFVEGSGYYVYSDSKGARHRLGGPAIKYHDGATVWYQNGLIHRLDGPAYEEPSGHKEWFVNDEKVDPQVLVAYWLEKGRCCWFDESTQNLCFSDP